MKNLSVVSCSKESHVFLLEIARVNHLVDFWIYIKAFKRGPYKGEEPRKLLLPPSPNAGHLGLYQGHLLRPKL